MKLPVTQRLASGRFNLRTLFLVVGVAAVLSLLGRFWLNSSELKKLEQEEPALYASKSLVAWDVEKHFGLQFANPKRMGCFLSFPYAGNSYLGERVIKRKSGGLRPMISSRIVVPVQSERIVQLVKAVHNNEETRRDITFEQCRELVDPPYHDGDPAHVDITVDIQFSGLASRDVEFVIADTGGLLGNAWFIDRFSAELTKLGVAVRRRD